MTIMTRRTKKMKKTKIKFMGVEVKVYNTREERLVRILNENLGRICEYWDDPEWRESFDRHGSEHWMFERADGLLTAMYFMGLIQDPTSSVEVYEAVRHAWLDKEVA